MAGRSKAISAPITDKKTEIAKSAYQRITDEKVREILAFMEAGNSERKSCELVGVNRSSFRQQLPRFQVATHYAEALAVQAEAQAIDIEDTLDQLKRGEIDAATARVIIDTRKWFASKLLPKKYGDKLDVTSDGKALPQPLLGGVTVTKQED